MQELKIDDVRPEVKKFAIAMEKRLRENDFYDEFCYKSIDCIDISNYCMMLYDKIEKY